MADVSINNAGDLKAEIIRLRQLRGEQGTAIQTRFSSPSAIYHTIGSLFPKSADGKNGIFNQDIFGLLSRVLLPLTLNKTIFRNSNFIVKALVGYLSQKASHFVNEDKVMGVWDKIMSIFEKKKHVDYCIPPESEAS
jgi:hypothetical protein